MNKQTDGDEGGHDQPLAVNVLTGGERRCRRCCGDCIVLEPMLNRDWITCPDCRGSGVEPSGCIVSEHLRVVTARPPETKLEGAVLPERPKFPHNIILREGDLRRKCPLCGSSLVRRWFGLLLGGCEARECPNHDSRKTEGGHNTKLTDPKDSV